MSQRISGCVYFVSTVNKLMCMLGSINRIQHNGKKSPLVGFFMPEGNVKSADGKAGGADPLQRAPIATSEKILHLPQFSGYNISSAADRPVSSNMRRCIFAWLVSPARHIEPFRDPAEMQFPCSRPGSGGGCIYPWNNN